MSKSIIKPLGIFIILVLIISALFSVITNYDSNVKEGDIVILKIGKEEIYGRIYTVRGDGRYTIRYLTDNGIAELGTFKRFEFSLYNTPETNYNESDFDK